MAKVKIGMVNYKFWKKLTKWADEDIRPTHGQLLRHALIMKKSTGPLTRGEKAAVEAVWKDCQKKMEV